MYVLRSAMVKNCVCWIFPSSFANFASSVACPLCRRPHLTSATLQTARQQSTSTKTSLVDMQLNKKKEKSKTEEYSELIQVEETSGNAIKQSRPVVKKTTMKVILQNLSADTRKQAARKLSKKTDSIVDSQKSTKPKSTKARSKVSSPSRAMSYKSENVALAHDLTGCPSCEVENVNGTSLEPLFQGVDGDPNFFPDDEVDEFQDTASSKSGKSTGNARFPKRISAQNHKKASDINKAVLKGFGKDLHLNISLNAFLDVCINSDRLDEAYRTLMHYRINGRNVEGRPKPTDIRLYNTVINGFAKKGNWSRVKEVLAVIHLENIKPNLQTYVGCLECISYLPTKDETRIRFLLQDASKNGLDLAKMDIECTFTNDQRERVIDVKDFRMVRVVSPNFQPTPRRIEKHYSCKLLSRLNEEPSEDRLYDPLGGTMTYDQLLANLRSQLETEVSNTVSVRSIEKRAFEADENLEQTRDFVAKCEVIWRATLLRAYNENIEKLRERSKRSKSITFYPFLTALDAKSYVDIMLREIRSVGHSSESYSLPLWVLHAKVGHQVMTSYMVAMKQKQGLISKLESLYRKYCEYYVNHELTSRFTPREYWQKIVNENMDGPSTDVESKIWPDYIVSGVGKFLYDIIIGEVKINTNFLKCEAAQGLQTPAINKGKGVNGIRQKDEIKPHPILAHMYRLETKKALTFEGTVVPSLVPPLPWTSLRSGGSLLSSVKMIRISEVTTHHKRRLEQTPNEQLFAIYDSLNQLGECPWKVNKPILDIIIDIFNNNGNEALAIPPPLSECPPLPSLKQEISKENKEEMANVRRERAILHRKRIEMHSLRCDGLYKLSIANHYRDKMFWFPHNMDFRGRVYPSPPHFNHLGNDMTRSILLFAKGEPLGKKGLDWLKIHLTNLTGFKKQEPILKRLEFANEMLPEIIDSADDPLNGRRWWTKSEEPWQTLACCKEIADAVRSPNPEKYVCHFPIHQDGSCNGLQHYAALGRDEQGARQVNLYPMDEPKDVYNGVARLVEEARAKDAEAGNEIAKTLEGFIKRKVVKQTVMTTVYGVTRYGAHNQIKKQLKSYADFPEHLVWKGSVYLTEKVFESLKKMFTATKEIQSWLADVAKQIVRVNGQPVEWVTPLGLPIVQPYHKAAKCVTPLDMGDKGQSQRHLKLDIFRQLNVTKQSNAFSPNFIHSLDSSHMMLTSLFCQREGITFVSVHDCYWTHASKSIEIMNKICRQQFVALHNEPILENLSKFLAQKYGYCPDECQDEALKFALTDVELTKERLTKLITNLPATGNFDLNNVLRSTYFFC